MHMLEQRGSTMQLQCRVVHTPRPQLSKYKLACVDTHNND
jgi:hypothetical protein